MMDIIASVVMLVGVYLFGRVFVDEMTVAPKYRDYTIVFTSLFLALICGLMAFTIIAL